MVGLNREIGPGVENMGEMSTSTHAETLRALGYLRMPETFMALLGTFFPTGAVLVVKTQVLDGGAAEITYAVDELGIVWICGERRTPKGFTVLTEERCDLGLPPDAIAGLLIALPKSGGGTH